jgi:hypothetical protein
MDPEADFDKTVAVAAGGGGASAGTGRSGSGNGGATHVLVVGGSNAKRLCEVLKEAGIEAELLHMPNLRIIHGAGEMIAEKLKEAGKSQRRSSFNFSISVFLRPSQWRDQEYRLESARESII